ncbi:SH3 domain-containing protein [Devosia sp.]|uniref:SH3 domain-containing protein n=1 Tax=Devosia sp. TaxID=1871048 RepID=UPI001AD40182|nr:SH3 domain-containing protein [Devosia sp.]MBN9309979.1 SH3 domain-containing protein [Devosia sp.]
MLPIRLAGAAALLLGSLLFASAANAAVATSTVNVRNAPVNGAVVDVLRAGDEVEIDRCTGGWCYVIKPGPDGWVSQAFLSDEDYAPVPSRPAPTRPDVDVSIGFSVPGFSFQAGSGGFDVRPGRPGGLRDRVCFYERTGFRGDSFCARPGERLARLGTWDDSIRSIEVRGDAQALVCERANFNGRCIVISRSVPDLRGARDEISSIRVR